MAVFQYFKRTEDEITLCENFFLVSNHCRLAEQQGRVVSEEEINEWTSKSNIIRDLLEQFKVRLFNLILVYIDQ